MPVISVQSFGVTTATARRLAGSVRKHVIAALPETAGVCQCRVLPCAAAELPEPTSSPHAYVEVTAFPGRSLEDKRALYGAIVAGLATAGIPAAAVTIALHEPALENWGIRGGRPALDVLHGSGHNQPHSGEGDPS